jgi:hypothetical protein
VDAYWTNRAASGKPALSQDAGTPVTQAHQRGSRDKLEGTGISVVYGPTQLTVTWADGSILALRFDAVAIEAELERPPGEGVVVLRFGARMDRDVPQGVMSGLNVALRFPETIPAEVERLAERLRPVTAARGDDRPGSVTGQLAHPRAGMPDARAPASRPAPVRIHAAPACWADDPSWVGLYPPRETERLLLVPPGGRANPTEHPQAT